jgi:hypothetical protein
MTPPSHCHCHALRDLVVPRLDVVEQHGHIVVVKGEVPRNADVQDHSQGPHVNANAGVPGFISGFRGSFISKLGGFISKLWGFQGNFPVFIGKNTKNRSKNGIFI